MLFLRQPSPDAVLRFVAAQANLTVTYPHVGASNAVPPGKNGPLPKGYVVDHNRIQLGRGAAVFAAAKAAFQRWDHFHFGWLDACAPLPPIQTGAVVAIKAKSVGLWWLSACRIVYTIDEKGDEMGDETGEKRNSTARFGFGYGTLPDHPESGEERFLLEWNRADDTVWYDILAFSRPNTFAARLGYPIVRSLQKHFQRDTKAAMLRVVAQTGAQAPHTDTAH
ncbi:MAG TPA: DUF1990 domain-containing protein [Planctomycetota bacterium]|nr:DUF1990 domain-containing protein [Planctomycetota bacterium]